jgi:hypothetical protein
MRKPEGTSLCRSRHRRENNTLRDLTETVCENMDSTGSK